MNWRERILTSVGPGMLGGVTFGQWWRLLRQEHFAIDLPRWPRAMAITMQSLKNSAFLRFERRRYGPLLENVRIEPPLFVLGHWRNGTTHLHQLLACDARFAFPNGYQISFPHTFLTTEVNDKRWMQWFLPEHRPMDNVTWSLDSPQEDEFALGAASLKSPCLGWVFPRRREEFGRYLTFRGASPLEIAEWRAAFELFLKKLTWKYQRPLILKSPPHTARIRLLLEMFPEAKFVHIHRHPHVVFQSSRKMFSLMFGWQELQRHNPQELDDWIIRQYAEMYDAFFEECPLIPQGQYHELAFEDLERDPVSELRKLYVTLALPDFEAVEADLRQYNASLVNYRKNQFAPLCPKIQSRLNSSWRTSLEAWGYA